MTKQRFHPGRDKPRLDQLSNPETDGLEVRRWRRGTTSRRNLTSDACQGTSSVRCVASSGERFRRPESTGLAQSAARRCAWSLVQTHARTAVRPSRSRSTCLVCRLHVDREAGINRQRLKNRPCLVGEGDCPLYPVRDLITVHIPDGHAELHRPFHASPPLWSSVVLPRIPARTPVNPRAHHGDGSPSHEGCAARERTWQYPCSRRPQAATVAGARSSFESAGVGARHLAVGTPVRPSRRSRLVRVVATEPAPTVPYSRGADKSYSLTPPGRLDDRRCVPCRGCLCLFS